MLNALYEFDGTTWILKTAEGAPGSPPQRGGAAVAWNFSSNKLVVFGGDTGGATPTLLGDTWEWDPVTNTWTDVTPATSPAPRRYAAMSWDPTIGGMLLFGGELASAPSACAADTWWLLSGAWVQLNPTHTPPARRQHSLCTRSDFGDVFLCAGVDTTAPMPPTAQLDTWQWNGSDWLAIVPTTSAIPAAVHNNQAVYDPLRQRIVLQGGYGIGTVNASLYPTYMGSPTTWCSEFDCVRNEWLLYGAPAYGTADPTIGRIYSYFGAFVPALGKVIKVSGQNPVGVGVITPACQYQANPLPTTQLYGNGCTGPGGTLALAPVTLPWTTRVFRALGTGFGPQSLGISMMGLPQAAPGAVPLATLPIPGGGVGCDLLTSLEITGLEVPTAGQVQYGIFVPGNDPTLIGLPIFLQLGELDWSAGWVGSYTTNGIRLTVGAM